MSFRTKRTKRTNPYNFSENHPFFREVMALGAGWCGTQKGPKP